MTESDCTCPTRLGCARHDAHVGALDGACAQLLDLLESNGAHAVELSVARDGRVFIRLMSDAGYMLRTVHADLVPGSALERPSVAISAISGKGRAK